MTFVSNQNEIPKDKADAIRARLRQRIDAKLNEMSDYEVSILDKSERDFRDFVAEIFKSIAATLGYIIGVVVGTVSEIVDGVKSGFKGGFDEGRRKRY
ncbi:hypothetical protein [Oscillatoria sp. HE19RPO]|uniref:hypothetical protein n=1 Tax=Oscillatoria sp. HE19RPO TaxID=2954806 RepID=UPI0020C32114|nr:hypothetical protein [Oscillatoria sp. HE19RPO]